MGASIYQQAPAWLHAYLRSLRGRASYLLSRIGANSKLARGIPFASLLLRHKQAHD